MTRNKSPLERKVVTIGSLAISPLAPAIDVIADFWYQKILFSEQRETKITFQGRLDYSGTIIHLFEFCFISSWEKMASIVVDKEILADLGNSKLKILQEEEIQAILQKWHDDDIPRFLTDAKTGIIEDAEDDAICLKNLVEKREKYYNLRSQWS